MKEPYPDYMSYRIEKSDELFQDAELLYNNRRWRSCVNRLYYSSFQLVSAIMSKHGVETKSHNGLKTNFYQYYIKTNVMNSDFGRLYSQLMDWRQESDYAEFVEFSEEDVAPLMIQVKEFNAELKKILKTKAN
jgi:uncharacterized protein (UPF0332 family)